MTKRLYRVSFALGLMFFLASNFSLYAQVDNTFFHKKKMHLDSGEISLAIDQLNFARNTEYKTLVAEGSTLLGYQVWPEVVYQVNPNHQLRGGVFLHKDFGNNAITQLQPTLQWRSKFKKSELLFGTLDGNLQHGLIDPLYNPEFGITRRLENGLQYLHKSRRLSLDAWIDWETMIYPNSPFREEFTTGVVSEFFLIQKDQFKVSIPFQALIKHQGGEIDKSGLPVSTRYNFMTGGQVEVVLDNGLSFQLKSAFTNYEDITTIPVDTFEDGLGQFINLVVQKNKTGVMLGYWDSHQFQSPGGDPLYFSQSTQNKDYLYFARRMASVRLFFEKEINEHLSFLFRAHYLRDLNYNTDDIAIETYLRWNLGVPLNRRRRSK